MKTLTTVAVFGLVPFPPLPDTHACNDSGNQPTTAEGAKAARLVRLQPDAAERMATNDELAHIRQELRDVPVTL
jgi:hypothetical protein